MPKKTVVPDLDRFRPPGFDLKAYSRKTHDWSAQQWYEALWRRAEAFEALNAFARTDRSLDDWGWGSRNLTEAFIKALLPELFGPPAENAPRPFYKRTTDIDFRLYSGAVVKDLSIATSLHLYEMLQGVPDFVRTHDLNIDPDDVRGFFDASQVKGIIHPDLWDSPVRSLLENGCSNLAWSYEVPLEVDLHAPDVELVAAFERWLAQARETYGIPQPEPEIIRKKLSGKESKDRKRKERPPIFDKKNLDSWHSHNIIPFLDLYLWNLWHNPPPLPGLWSDRHDRFSFGGQAWTVVEQTWLGLVGWPSERTLRRDVVDPGLKLLERESLRLLAVFAEKERAQSVTSMQSGQDSL